jgi:hypothetical protein
MSLSFLEDVGLLVLSLATRNGWREEREGREEGKVYLNDKKVWVKSTVNRKAQWLSKQQFQ